MKKLILPILFVACSTLTARGAEIDFHRDVAPILREYCAGCHNDDELKGEFSLETWKLLMKGGEDGPSIKPGDAEGSRLIQLLSGKKKPYMPPRKKAQPSATHIETLRAWIDAGAKGPGNDLSILSTLSVPELAAAENVEKPITALAFSPTGTRAVARFTSVKVGKQALAGHPGKINSISFSKDGKRVVTATGVTGLSGEAFLWDVETGKLIRRFTGEHRDILFDAELSPDGAILATAGYDRSIKVWETGSGKLLRTIEGHNGAIYDIAFSPDGSVLASAGGDASVKLWQVSTGLRLDTLGQPTGEQFNVAFTPDSRFIIASGADKQIRLWNWISREKPRVNPLVLVRFAHEDEITSFVISEDGSRLASSSADRTVKTWSLPGLDPLQTFDKQSDVVATLAFTPGERSLFVGRLDGSRARLKLDKIAVAEEAPRPNTVPAAVNPAGEKMTAATESEPNDSAKDANTIQLPAMVAGVIENADGRDSDLFKFRAKAGEEWVLEINAARSKSKLDSKIEVLDAGGRPIERLKLQALRKSWLTFRGKDSNTTGDFRLFKWDEMTVNQLLYVNGEVVKLWHYPRGPDSGYIVYPGRGNRYGFYDTTPLAHPLGQNAYIVQPLPRGVEPVANGLPAISIYYENDDESFRRLGSDSRLTFTAPADGEYLVRVSDVRGLQGKDYKYTLNIRPRKGDFSVNLGTIPAGVPNQGGREFSVSCQRFDDFDGPIRVDITEVPPGFRITTPIVIEAGQTLAYGAVYHDPATARKAAKPKAIEPNPSISKLSWKFYHGQWPKVPDWSKLKPVKSGELDHGFIDIGMADRTDYYGFHFEGTLEVKKKGSYEFILASDDGSLLFIDGKKIVDVDGLHSNERKTGKLNLESGKHPISVGFIEATGEAELYLGWKGPGFGETPLTLTSSDPDWARVNASAMVDGREVKRPVNLLTGIKLGGKPSLRVNVAPDGNGPVTKESMGSLEKPLELTIAPGETISARVIIERGDFKGRVDLGGFDSGRNLPHGVYVDNIGLNGLLIVEGQSERRFFITADKWVEETTRRFHIRAAPENGLISPPILLHIRRK